MGKKSGTPVVKAGVVRPVVESNDLDEIVALDFLAAEVAAEVARRRAALQAEMVTRFVEFAATRNDFSPTISVRGSVSSADYQIKRAPKNQIAEADLGLLSRHGISFTPGTPKTVFNSRYADDPAVIAKLRALVDAGEHDLPDDLISVSQTVTLPDDIVLTALRMPPATRAHVLPVVTRYALARTELTDAKAVARAARSLAKRLDAAGTPTPEPAAPALALVRSAA